MPENIKTTPSIRGRGRLDISVQADAPQCIRRPSFGESALTSVCESETHLIVL